MFINTGNTMLQWMPQNNPILTEPLLTGRLKLQKKELQNGRLNNGHRANFTLYTSVIHCISS